MTTRSTFRWYWRGAEWEGAQISSYLEPAFPEHLPIPRPPGTRLLQPRWGTLLLTNPHGEGPWSPRPGGSTLVVSVALPAQRPPG